MVASTLDNLITRNPEIHNNQPLIGGTGVAVRTVIGHYKLGLTAEEIADEMDLKLAGVYAALAYYHLNRDEIESDIIANLEATVIAEVGRG